MEAFSTSPESTFSVEASRSRARTSVLPAAAQASRKGPGRVFGSSSQGSLGNYDPATSSLRTSQLSLLEDSTGSLQTLPRSGSMRNGTVYQHQPLAPLTAGTASGSLPTPVTGESASGHGRRGASGNPKHQSAKSLDAMARDGSLQQWATPTAWLGQWNAHSKGDPKRWHDPARSNELSDQVAASGTSGQLNPTWVEWLMGFPLGWTVSRAWETRLSRRSRSGSGEGSSSTKRN